MYYHGWVECFINNNHTLTQPADGLTPAKPQNTKTPFSDMYAPINNRSRVKTEQPSQES